MLNEVLCEQLADYNVQGAITTLYGCVAFFFLPHTPGTARFFTEDEKRAAVQRLHHDMHGADTKVAVDQEEFAWKWVFPSTPADPQTLDADFTSSAWPSSTSTPCSAAGSSSLY